MVLPQKIRLTEVCPRDGLQNIGRFIDTADKIALVRDIADTGVAEIEITSFVHPKFVPQFKDATEVYKGVAEYARARGVDLIALVPNKKGAVNAKAAGVTILNCVLSASELHNKRNVNKTVAESLTDLGDIIHEVENVEVRLAMACTFGSPFADTVSIDQVKRICDAAFAIGIDRIGLADSAGISTPAHTGDVIQALKKDFDIARFSVHLHDTRGMGIANAYVALTEGVTSFDASLGGLGGCPFIPGARGNIASEDFVNMVAGMGIATGCDLEKMMAIAMRLPHLTGQAVASSMTACRQCGQGVAESK